MKTRPPSPYPTIKMDTYLYIDLYGATLCPRSLIVRAGLYLAGLSYCYRKTSLFQPELPKESIYAELPLLKVGWQNGRTSFIEDYRGILLFIDEKLTGKDIFPSHIPSRTRLFDALELLDTEILPFLFFPILVQKRQQRVKALGFPRSSLKQIWSIVSGAPIFPLPYPMPYTAFDDDLLFQAVEKLSEFMLSDAVEFPLIARIVSETLSLLKEHEYTSTRLAQSALLQNATIPQRSTQDYGT